MEVAAEVFADHGFSGVGMRELCARCGIGAPTLYHYFGSKERLFEAVCVEKYKAAMVVASRTVDADHLVAGQLDLLCATVFDLLVKDRVLFLLLRRDLIDGSISGRALRSRHQYDGILHLLHKVIARREHVPGDAGIWLFILGDMVIYGLFFLFYAQARSQAPTLFAEAQAALDPMFGVANTLILLTSSWFVVKGVGTARAGKRDASARWLLWALVCGSLFCISKAIEYTLKIDSGIVITSNPFYMYYYLLTAFHLVHVLIGMAVLVFMRRAIGLAPEASPPVSGLESGASFWHLVDLLWILIFPLLYLIA
jgi:nitric oxide reductase NorE protein